VAAIVIAYAQPLKNWSLTRQVEVPAPPVNSSAKTTGEKTRSLALQPEALKLAKRIGGARFQSLTAASVMQGVVKTDGDNQQVTIVRRQTVDGERVEVALSGGRASLAWARDSGPQRSGGAALSQNERLLLERLTADTADQFVLAQLRGASYSVVIRNLRPDDTGDEYAGPLWDVVRVDDPEPDEQKRPLSPWRLYYINRTTGLIDKVVSEVEGERFEAQFSDWAERNGEKFPGSISWSRGGQTVMTFNLHNVYVAAN
jgi:hypothetical protein